MSESFPSSVSTIRTAPSKLTVEAHTAACDDAASRKPGCTAADGDAVPDPIAESDGLGRASSDESRPQTPTIDLDDVLLSDWIVRRYLAWTKREVRSRQLRPSQVGIERGRPRDDGRLDIVTDTSQGELVFTVPRGHWELAPLAGAQQAKGGAS